MLEGLADLIRGRAITPKAPADFTPQLPAADDLYDLDDDQSPDLATIAGVGCVITYEDSSGAVSFRRITCWKLSHKSGVRYLQAHCHERGRARTFRVDRVLEVVCASTGEVFNPSADFFDGYEAVNDGGGAVGFGLHVRLAADLKAALNVLTFLAKVDGVVVPEEQEVISQFCQAFGLRYATDDFDCDGAARFASNLAPDSATFFAAMERLTRSNAAKGLARLTRRYAERLIAADGVQHEKEFRCGLQIQEYLA